jgi:hypothetical protein
VSQTLLALLVLKVLHGTEGGGSTDQFVRELALVVGLVILDLLVVLLGVVCEMTISASTALHFQLKR